MAIRVRWYLSRCQQDVDGAWRAWIERQFNGYAWTIRAPSNQMALVRLHGEQLECERVEALAGFALNARVLRLALDPLYSSIDSPALRLLLAEWGLDAATIPDGTRLRQVIQTLGRISDGKFDEWGAMIEGLASERLVD